MIQFLFRLKMHLLAYFNKFTIAAYAFFLLQVTLAIVLAYRNAPKVFDLNAIRILNYNFSGAVFTGIPVTILVAISREFGIGYVSKLAGSGISRKKYFFSKLSFTAQLSLLVAGLYMLTAFIFSIFFEPGLPFNLLAYYYLFTLPVFFLINNLATLLAFFLSDWKLSVPVYIGYCLLESMLVYAYKDKFPAIEWMPVNTLVSSFQLDAGITSSGFNLLRLLCIFILLLALLPVALRQFRNREL